MQLLVREEVGHAPMLEAVEAIGSEAPDAWGGRDPLPIGSQDLVELTVHLREQGYRITDLAIVDYRFTSMDGIDDLKDNLIRLLRNNTEQDAVRFISESMSGLYVQNVELRDTGPQNGRITLVQDGLIRSSSLHQLAKIPQVLRAALGYETSKSAGA